ncbi:MAG: 2-oxo acid dehydrogenase subunit E2, partial [Sedimentisphaerales bacterium]|nr:2-oxo acid dehydrogenase subunit E2 [Sedimentisphaerales bacterium]
LFAVDDMVPVGKVVALIGEAGEAVESATGAAPAEAAKATPATATPTQTPAPTVSASDDKRIKASPVAKKLAEKLGIDITLVMGTGPNGRILGKDVQQYAASAPAVASGPTMVPAEDQPQPGSTVQMTKMRRAIGLNLQMSSRETPHFNVTMSIDMSHAMGVRKQLNETRSKEKRISVNDLVVRACALALKQCSAVNSRMEEDKIHYMADINIGVATAVADGLVVPVLTHADSRDWDDIAAQTKRLANEARSGKIIGAGKGTFTVSNLGMFGVDNFTAIINPPESAILAVGAIKDEVVVIEGGIGIRPMMKVILCSDHRIIDGALAAQFLQAVKTYLEEEIN